MQECHGSDDWPATYEVKERCESKQQVWRSWGGLPVCQPGERVVFFFVDWAEMEHAVGSGNNKLPVGQKICPDRSPPEPK